MVVNILTKPNKVQDLIDLISDDEEVYNIIQAIYIQETFSFPYNVCEKTRVDRNYPNLGHDFDNFKVGAKVAVGFQVNSKNFKASKKIDVVKAYSFRLLGVYLVDDLSNETMLTPEKWCPGDNEWMITLPQMKKTYTSMNPLEMMIDKS